MKEGAGLLLAESPERLVNAGSHLNPKPAAAPLHFPIYQHGLGGTHIPAAPKAG